MSLGFAEMLILGTVYACIVVAGIVIVGSLIKRKPK